MHIIFWLILLGSLWLNVFAQTNLFNKIKDENKSEKKNELKNQLNKKIDFSKFPNDGIFFLEDVTIDDLRSAVDLAQKSKNSNGGLTKKPIKFDYQNIILRLFRQTNELIVRTLAEKIDKSFKEEQDLSVLYNTINENLKSQDSRGDKKSSRSSLKKSDLFDAKSTVGIVLRKADVVSVYNIEVTNQNKKETQRMVELTGNVLLMFGGNSLNAKRVVVNSQTKNINAEGNAVLNINKDIIYGDRIIINLEEQVGYIFDVAGKKDGLYFEGKLLKINNKEHYTLEDGWVTFSSNADPYYRVGVSTFDTYGKDRKLFANSVVYVHNQPFFWLPFFIVHPTTTGLRLKFGETRREGYYFLTELAFNTEKLSDININFNIYEKLGLYLGLNNKNKLLNSDYNINLVGVYYTDNLVTQKKPSKLTYTHNTSPYITSVSALRHKIVYDHNFNFNDSNSKLKNSFKISLKNVSDPLLTSTFPLDLKHFDIRELIERSDKNESFFEPSGTDSDYYRFKYNLSAPKTSLGIDIALDYAVYNDPNLTDATIDKRYTMYLKNRTLPNINFSHGGIFDPYDAKSNKPFHFNIGYTTGLSYSLKSTYKDGTAKGSGSGLLVDIEPYELTKEDYNLKLNFNLNRPFSFDRDKSSIVDFGLDWLDWSLTPSFGYTLAKSWKKDLTSSDDIKDDREDKTLSFSLGSQLNFNRNIPTYFDVIVQNNWSISSLETTFFYEESDFLFTEANRDLEDLDKTIKSSYSFGIDIEIPSNKLKSKWSSSYTYHSMLPVFSWTVFKYNLNKITSQEKKTQSDWYSLDELTARNFSSSMSFTQKGYGLFYLRDLDYTLSSSASLSYNLLPTKEEQKAGLKKSLFDNTVWAEDKFSSFSGYSSWDLKYKIWHWKNQLNYIFYDTTSKKLVPIMTSYQTTTGLSYKISGVLNEWFNLKSTSINYGWNYYFRAKDYKNDSMSFSLQSVFDLFGYFTLALSFSASNPKSYLYFEDKARELGAEKVNFFSDLVSSLGLLGSDKQQSGLFKLGTTTLSLYHDLDDFFLNLTYSLAPVNYNNGSLTGFYFDHKVSFEINLKTDRDPRGPEKGKNDPFFEKLEDNFRPSSFDL